MNLCIYTCFVYLQPFCVILDFKLFIDSIHILFLLYLLVWFWDFTIKILQDCIKIYRALIKDIFPRAVKHGILVHTKVLPSRTKLDLSERTMKKLLPR